MMAVIIELYSTSIGSMTSGMNGKYKRQIKPLQCKMRIKKRCQIGRKGMWQNSAPKRVNCLPCGNSHMKVHIVRMKLENIKFLHFAVSRTSKFKVIPREKKISEDYTTNVPKHFFFQHIFQLRISSALDMMDVTLPLIAA